MNREQFEARLNELLDRRIAPEADPEVLRVAEQFTECRAVLGAYRALFDGVAEMDLPRPPADLARNVMAQWRREKAGGRYLVAQRRVVSGATSRSALFAAAAALLLVGPGLGWLWQRSATSQAQASTPLQTTAKTPANSPDAVEPDPVAEVATASAPSTEPRATPSPSAAGQIASLLGSGQRPAGDSSSAAPAENVAAAAGTPANGATPASDGAAWVGEVSQGFQPIAESAAGALDFLLEVLADGSDDTRG